MRYKEHRIQLDKVAKIRESGTRSFSMPLWLIAGPPCDEGKDVIPVVIQECRIPFRLRPFQYADFSVSYDSSLELLSGLSGEHQATAHTTASPEDKAAARDDECGR